MKKKCNLWWVRENQFGYCEQFFYSDEYQKNFHPVPLDVCFFPSKNYQQLLNVCWNKSPSLKRNRETSVSIWWFPKKNFPLRILLEYFLNLMFASTPRRGRPFKMAVTFICDISLPRIEFIILFTINLFVHKTSLTEVKIPL